MAAVFEIIIGSRELIPFQVIENILSKYQVCIDSVETMDDWNYNNLKKLEKVQIFQMEKLISKGKILILNGVLDNLHNCGMHIFTHETGIFNIAFWISTKQLYFLDCDRITEKNIKIYDEITQNIIDNVNKNHFMFCGIGSEIFMPDSYSINDVVSKSKNVNRWIFSNKEYNDFPDDYQKKTWKQFTVYSLLGTYKWIDCGCKSKHEDIKRPGEWLANIVSMVLKKGYWYNTGRL